MGLLEWYHYLNDELADEKVKDWFLMSSPIPLTLISIAYLYVVLKLGPEYMKNRPEYSCLTFMKLYNIFQIFANAFIVYSIFENRWYEDYFFNCVDIDNSPTPQNVKFAVIWWYLLCLKIVDYLETIVFVLRKKQRQISFLHLYHHISTAVLGWIGAKYYCNGMSITLGVVNCTVHVVMYTYYLLSTMGPKIQKSLYGIKRMITILQMAQFWFLILHSLRAFYPGCPKTELWAVVIIINLVINFIMFYNFYQKSYGNKTKRK